MTNETQNFDPTDWNSIKDMIQKVSETSILTGENVNGEFVIFDVGCYEEPCLVTTTLQFNGWNRINIYHPDDLLVEEMFKRR